MRCDPGVPLEAVKVRKVGTPESLQGEAMVMTGAVGAAADVPKGNGFLRLRRLKEGMPGKSREIAVLLGMIREGDQ